MSKLHPRPSTEASAPITVTPWNVRAWLELGVVVLVALAIRAIYAFWIQNEFWFHAPLADSKNYHEWAQAIVQGDVLGNSVWKHSPLYAFCVAGVYALTGYLEPYYVSNLQLWVVAPLACGLMYALGRRLANGTVGLAAGLMQAFYAPGIFLDGNVLSALLIHGLNLGVLLTAYAALRRGHWWLWVIPGGLLGLSMLARPNAVLLIPVFGVWLWIHPATAKTRRHMVLSLASLCVTAGLFMVPVGIRNQVVLHEPIFTAASGGLNFFLGNHRDATGYLLPKGTLGQSASDMLVEGRDLAERRVGHALTFSESSRYWAGLGWKEILHQPAAWVELMMRKLGLLANDFEFSTSLNYHYVHDQVSFFRFPWFSFGSVLALGFAGMWYARKRWVEWFPIYGLIGVYALSNVFILITSEYRFGMMPALFVFAGLALREMALALRQKQWRTLTVPGGLIVVGLLLGFAPAVPQDLKSYHMATAYIKLGSGHAELGDNETAIRYLETAMRLLQGQEEFWPNVQLRLGQVHLRLGHVEEAVRLLSEAHMRRPQVAEISNALANALNTQKKYVQALELRRAVVAQEPDNPDYMANLGITLLWMGKDAEAQEAFDRAFDMNPDKISYIQGIREHVLKTRSRKH